MWKKLQSLRRWLRNIEDHEILLKELHCNGDGKPVSGILELTRYGETRRFNITDGRLPESRF
jgi:hypothetical protein